MHQLPSDIQLNEQRVYHAIGQLSGEELAQCHHLQNLRVVFRTLPLLSLILYNNNNLK